MLPSLLGVLSCVMWLQLPARVMGHARLMSPPSRSSMWRLGFPTKKNFNDNALYCGGIQIQWKKNNGKCGICGDPYDTPSPRENEAGGKYGRGIISRQYLSGQIMEAVVDVTTNHRGYFEFKLCPNNNPKKEATQECLDKYTLKLADGSDTKYFIADKGNGDIKVQLQLPKGLTCSQCVFQWTYVAGNNWGRCDDGESGLGCGPQETFRGCADIAIGKNIDILPHRRPSQNDIRGGQTDANSFYKSTKQKYFRDTSISKYPKYALEASSKLKSGEETTGKSKSDSSYSWLVSGNVSEQPPSKPAVSQKNTSQSAVQGFESHDLRKYFENWRDVESPTPISKYQKYALGSSSTKQSAEDTTGKSDKDSSKPYSWLVSGTFSEQTPSTPTVSPKNTSQSTVQAWEPHSLRKYFENWQGVDSPTAEEIFLGKSGSEHDLFAAKLVNHEDDDDNSHLRDIFQKSGEDIELLKFYLQGSEPPTVTGGWDRDSYDGFNFGGRRYKDIWFL